MISKKMQKALNDQLNRELYSAYLYTAIGACFEHKNLSGFAQWVIAHAQEEVGHAQKIYKYLNDVRARVELDAIAKPPLDYASPLAAFQQILKHEQAITGHVHKLVQLARQESDYATEVFLQWFVTEQVEEESVSDDFVQKLKVIGDDPRSLLIMDRQLAARAG